MTLSINDTQNKRHSPKLCHYAECRILFLIVLNVVMLIVISLSVMAPFLLLPFLLLLQLSLSHSLSSFLSLSLKHTLSCALSKDSDRQASRHTTDR
jgi:hypothetical protein